MATKNTGFSGKEARFHLITQDVERVLREFDPVNIGVLHLFIQHTSASLTLNENWEPTVRSDIEAFFTRAIPEDNRLYLHIDEGPNDMPAHIKHSLLVSSLTIPISNGQLQLGTWQGIYLCEHRNNANGRTVMFTLNGQMLWYVWMSVMLFSISHFQSRSL